MAKNKRKTGYAIRCAAAQALKIQGTLETGYNYDWNIYVDNKQVPSKISLLKHAIPQSSNSEIYNFVFNLNKISSVIGKQAFSRLFTNVATVYYNQYDITFYFILDDGLSYSYVQWTPIYQVFNPPIDCFTDKGWTITIDTKNDQNPTISFLPYGSCTPTNIQCTAVTVQNINFTNCNDRASSLCTEQRKNGFENCENFKRWYNSHEKKCCYCGVKEEDLTQYFNAENCQTKDARQRGEYLEIERVVTAPPACNVYTPDNTKLACYICNNAKSDFLSAQSFKPIARGINLFWQEKLKKYVEFSECDPIWDNDTGCISLQC